MIVREPGLGGTPTTATAKKTTDIVNPLSGTAGSPASTILDKGAALNGLSKTINNAPTSNTKNAPAITSGSAVGGSGTGGMVISTPTAPAVNSYEQYINDMMAAERDAQLNALEAEYTAAIGELEREKAAISPQYYEARRQTAGANARELQAMNEMFNAAGLSSGGRAQGAIAQSNVLQSELGALELAEAQALADVESRRTQIASQYQARVREAIMNNEMEKAAMLYEEAIRYDNAIVEAAKEKAQTLASIGDYSGYSALGYTADEIASLTKAAQRSSGAGSGGGATVADTPTLSLSTAKELAEAGDLSDNVVAALRAAGFTDANLQTLYGWNPEGMAPTPTTTTTPSLRNNGAITVYSAWKNGNLGTADAINVLEGFANRGKVNNDEIEYIFSQMGV